MQAETNEMETAMKTTTTSKAIKTEVRTDRIGRRVTWYVLADSRSFRSMAQALAAKPTAKKSKARRAATKSKIAAPVMPAPVAEVMTTEQVDVFTALANRTITLGREESLKYSRAMYLYMRGVETEEVKRTLGTQWQYAMQDVAQAAN